MSTDLQREDSFRTALKNQKRRLSATKLPGQVPKQLSAPDSPTLSTPALKPVGRRDSKPRLLPKQDSLPDINDSDCTEEEEEEAEIVAMTRSRTASKSRPGTPTEVRLGVTPPPSAVRPAVASALTPPTSRAASPFTPKKPSPLVMEDKAKSRSETKLATPTTPKLEARGRSPLPRDSPLLSQTPPPPSPTAKRVREMRRNGSFRRSLSRSRERSVTREMSETPEREVVVQQPEVSFSIRKHLGGRTGWKIMPEVETLAQLPKEALTRVVGMIKEMELRGHVIPERITIKV